MPARSKQQFKFMKAVEEGKITKSGLSPEKAKEFTEGMSKSKFKRLKTRLGKKKE